MSLFSDIEVLQVFGYILGYLGKKTLSRIVIDLEYDQDEETYEELLYDEEDDLGVYEEEPEVYPDEPSQEPTVDDVVDNAVAIAEQLIAECQVPNVPDSTIHPEPELPVAPVEPAKDAPASEGAEEVPVGTVSTPDETKATEGDIPVPAVGTDSETHEPEYFVDEAGYDYEPDSKPETFIPPYLTDVIEGDYTGSLPLGQANIQPKEPMKPEPLEGDLVAVQTYGQPESAPVIEEAQKPKEPEEVVTEPNQTVDAVIPVPSNATGEEMQPEEPKADPNPEDLLTTYGQFSPQAKPEEVAAIAPEVLGTEVVKAPDHLGEPTEPEAIVPVEVLTKEVEVQVEHPQEETDAVSPEAVDPDLSEADYEVQIDKEPDTSEVKVARASRKKAA